MYITFWSCIALSSLLLVMGANETHLIVKGEEAEPMADQTNAPIEPTDPTRGKLSRSQRMVQLRRDRLQRIRSAPPDSNVLLLAHGKTDLTNAQYIEHDRKMQRERKKRTYADWYAKNKEKLSLRRKERVQEAKAQRMLDKPTAVLVDGAPKNNKVPGSRKRFGDAVVPDEVKQRRLAQQRERYRMSDAVKERKKMAQRQRRQRVKVAWENMISQSSHSTDNAAPHSSSLRKRAEGTSAPRVLTTAYSVDNVPDAVEHINRDSLTAATTPGDNSRQQTRSSAPTEVLFYRRSGLNIDLNEPAPTTPEDGEANRSSPSGRPEKLTVRRSQGRPGREPFSHEERLRRRRERRQQDPEKCARDNAARTVRRDRQMKELKKAAEQEQEAGANTSRLTLDKFRSSERKRWREYYYAHRDVILQKQCKRAKANRETINQRRKEQRKSVKAAASADTDGTRIQSSAPRDDSSKLQRRTLPDLNLSPPHSPPSSSQAPQTESAQGSSLAQSSKSESLEAIKRRTKSQLNLTSSKERLRRAKTGDPSEPMTFLRHDPGKPIMTKGEYMEKYNADRRQHWHDQSKKEGFRDAYNARKRKSYQLDRQRILEQKKATQRKKAKTRVRSAPASDVTLLGQRKRNVEQAGQSHIQQRDRTLENDP